MDTSLIIKELKEAKDKISSSYMNNTLTTFSPSEKDWDRDNVPDSLRRNIIELDNILRHAAHNVRSENFALWNTIIDSMEDLTYIVGGIAKSIDRLRSYHMVPWYKKGSTYAVIFGCILVAVLFAFSLYRIDPQAAQGATGFVTDMTKSIGSTTSSVVGGGGSSGGGSDYNYGSKRNNQHDYGYTGKGE